MTKILANDGISQAGIDALTAKGFEVITEISFSTFTRVPNRLVTSVVKKELEASDCVICTCAELLYIFGE